MSQWACGNFLSAGPDAPTFRLGSGTLSKTAKGEHSAAARQERAN